MSFEHIDGTPCQNGPARPDDALCVEHDRLVLPARDPELERFLDEEEDLARRTHGS